ncbi:MAG TPA: phospholipase D-like domain-containing protein [Pyrinomonadaceae bacterium]|jgi:sugar-specific transcriptional regulator TrmB|nr:phospholipase D-like domain-containing protein [Pyrinomonadaceae bacterium]
MPDEIKLRGYHNCDDVQLFWRTIVDNNLDIPIDGCLGFSIERQRRNSAGDWGNSEILRNRVGFSNQPEDTGEGLPGSRSKPSNIWPFQRYDWTDHGANSGQIVRYRVVALRPPNVGEVGTDPLEAIVASPWTDEISVNADCGDGISAYFNRGTVMSQYVSRIARANNWSAIEIKENIRELEEPLRRFLSGELRVELLRLLDEVIDNPELSFYAALYELEDEELIGRLKLLRSRAHIVLANGSVKNGDGNEDARNDLKGANVDVYDRLLGSKGLGHNKFAIVVRKQPKTALKVWTGSTNWAATGLCTQINNGILIEDLAIARHYLNQWDNLAAAGSEFPPALVNANGQSPVGTANIDIWFTRLRKPPQNEPAADIVALKELVNGAQEMILYVMFQPGGEPLATILAKGNNSDVVVKGVVSTVMGTTEEQFTLNGVDIESREYRTALIQPEGIGMDFSAWVKEVTRYEFISMPNHPGIGHAITHSKMIVIDPFSDDCKVITGSHNFSKSASVGNDENFVVITGNKSLAEAYAVACLATYTHYRWRAYVKEKTEADESIWDHLSPDPAWQNDCLSDAVKKTLSLWCR